MRFLLVLSFLFITLSSSPPTLASQSVDCDIKLHMFNKLNMRTFRTFSGRVDYVYINQSATATRLYQKLNENHGDVCRPEISGDFTRFSAFLSTRLSSKTVYVGTLLFRTGQYQVNDSDISLIKSKMKFASGLLIVGRASPTGTKSANRKLSARRALGVADYFPEIKSATIIALGDQQTREERDDPRHDNRRVDIYAYQ